MTFDTLPLSVLVPSKDNPRSEIDAKRIEGLAASIQVDGLLQNLVVTPLKSSSTGKSPKTGRNKVITRSPTSVRTNMTPKLAFGE